MSLNLFCHLIKHLKFDCIANTSVNCNLLRIKVGFQINYPLRCSFILIWAPGVDLKYKNLDLKFRNFFFVIQKI